MNRKVGNIIKVLIILLLVGWVTLVFVDYFRNANEKGPLFCLKKTEKTYPDGKVYICHGLGYKSIRYDRKSMNAMEFGPFFIKERTEPKK